MKSIPTTCAVSGILVALALSANVANAGSVTVHTPTTTPPVFTGKHIPVVTIKAGVSSGSAANATAGDIKFTKQTDKSSPLFKNAVTGKHIPTGKITTRKAGGDQVLYDDKTTGGDDKPKESLSLSYGKVEWQYQTQK